MIPFFTQPILHLGPLTIHAFGVAVALAMLWGTRAAERVFERRALDKAIGARLAMWVLIGGVLGAHVFAVVLYFPQQLIADPMVLLRLWDPISSFGGMLGGVAGALLFFQAGAGVAARTRRWEYLESIAQVFPVSLAIGRFGCALAHYHPGSVTTIPLAISMRTQAAFDYIAAVYADASRPLPRAAEAQGFHDLGWYEFLFLALVVVPLFQLWQRRDKPGGFYLIAFPVLYLPVRFGLDFLRVADVRYAGLTPAQWVALVALSVVAIIMAHPNGPLRRKHCAS